MADGMAQVSPAEEAKTRKRAAAKPARRPARRKVKVDFWATDFNTAEIGIMKRTQNEAASDQFTKDMELYGQTVIDGKREALIGYRKELWDEKKGIDRRLIIKLFSETLGWRGTAEMMLGRSLQLSLAANGMPVPSFTINLARHNQLIQVERCAVKWPLLPDKYSFFIEDDKEVRFYTLRRHFFSFGADYSVYDQKGRKIGILDSQILNLGGAWMMRIDPNHHSRKLEAALELICAVLKFNRSSKSHIRKLAEKVMLGKLHPSLSHDERDLYLNPRQRR
ncbi:MAG: hypothetical protein AAFO63_06005 [Pseudomonadota bacterium]